jgi:sulfate/thiosulfate transport system substrate-binding protein
MTTRTPLNNSARAINVGAVIAVFLGFTLIVARNLPGDTHSQLLNVSYDPTRELYQRLDAQFDAQYEKQTGRPITVVQSHGGSSRQSRRVISGEEQADVVTLGMFSDVDALRKRGLIAGNWMDRLPNRSRPYTSTIVFVVRKGNPKNIHDWPDLVHSQVEVVTPNPMSSGNGRLSALAAWGAIVTRGGSEAHARAYLKALYQHVPVMDEGARGAAMTFVIEEIGDVLLTWENEAIRAVAESKGKLQIVYPPVSILAEPYVAWVDANVERRGTRAAAQAYLEFLFSDAGQETIAQFGYRPYKQGILNKMNSHPPSISLFPITAIARDWDDAEQKFFGETGVIDNLIGSASK